MLELLNFLLCSYALPAMIIGVGIFFLIKVRFFFILRPVRFFRSILSSSGGFRSLCVALSGTLGIGNIVGVASAVMMGGAGSVLWMVISAFIAMGVKYAEAFLAVRHRRGCVGNYHGGAPFYIQDACASPRVGRIFGSGFALLCILNSLSTGNLVQVGASSAFLTQGRIFLGIFIAFAVFIVIKGGIKRMQATSSVLIPLLSVLYIGISLFIIFSNLGATCVAISRIFKEAFSVRCMGAGACGYGISTAMRYGISRGLLSNEAGCGTSPTAHASSSLSAHAQGCLGAFEVFWDTIVLCPLTAIVILISPCASGTAMGLVISAYSHFLGGFGGWFIVFSCILFAIATICCQYYYGRESLAFLSPKKRYMYLYSAVFFAICVIASVISNDLIWQICDLIIAFLAIYNLVFLVILSKEVEL